MNYLPRKMSRAELRKAVEAAWSEGWQVSNLDLDTCSKLSLESELVAIKERVRGFRERVDSENSSYRKEYP